MTDNPAKAPEPCEYCGPICHRGAEHNARVEDNARFDDAERVIEVAPGEYERAVPAQPDMDPLAHTCPDCHAPVGIPCVMTVWRARDGQFQPIHEGREPHNRRRKRARRFGEVPAVPAQAAPQCQWCGVAIKPWTDRYVDMAGGELCQDGGQEQFPRRHSPKAEPQAGAQVPPIVYEGNMAFAQFVGVIEEAEKAAQPVSAPSPVIPSQDDYRFKTSEEAELLPLPLQILRLKEINAGLCNDHNTLVIMNAREREARKQAEDAYMDLLGEMSFIGERFAIAYIPRGPEVQESYETDRRTLATYSQRYMESRSKSVQEPAERERGK